MSPAADYTTKELMAAFVASEIRDDESVSGGAIGLLVVSPAGDMKGLLRRSLLGLLPSPLWGGAGGGGSSEAMGGAACAQPNHPHP